MHAITEAVDALEAGDPEKALSILGEYISPFSGTG